MSKDLHMTHKIAYLVNDLGGTTYFVGGYVRDKILNKHNKDIDIEIHGITPKDLYKLLSTLGEVKTQGSSFGVYNLKGYNIDIAQPRMEHVIGRGHKDFEVTVDPFIGTEKASKRRDFTINAIMENVLTGELIDHFNGINDLYKGIIRHVDDKSFGEDPLRVLRAAQFASRFEFNIAQETLDIMKTMDLSTLSKERIYEEMKKAMLKSKKPSTFFNILYEVNQLDFWFPELLALKNCEQNKKYHPEGDVWNHTMMVIDYASTLEVSNKEYFMLAALCHDFGKPLALSVDEYGYTHTYDHEIIGIDTVKTFLERLNSEVALHKYVINMVELHMRPHKLYQNKSKNKKTNMMFDKSICPEDLCKLAEADTSSKMNDEDLHNEIDFLTKRLAIYKERIANPEVTGKDLVELGLKPGPIFSEILSETHKKHLIGLDKEIVLKDIRTRYCK